MTQEQQQYVKRLSAKEATGVYSKLLKKDLRRANEFWQAWESEHPDLVPEPDSRTVSLGEAAWSATEYHSEEKEARVVDYAMQSGWTVSDRPMASMNDYLDGLNKHLSDREKVIYKVLSDNQPHHRTEILEALRSKGWQNDIDFRKHISNIRQALAATRAPYIIPKNESFKEGVYQLIRK